jgi:two-component system, NtrC family, response regulator HydG
MADLPRVLVVDDDPLTLKLIDRVLRPAGYDVVTAGGGPEALEHVKHGIFDAAVVDLRMPGMDGLEVLRALKRHDAAIEVVMTTAHLEVSTAVEALREGAHDYLQKPLNLDELRHRLGRVLEHRFLRREVSSLRTRLGMLGASDEITPADLPALTGSPASPEPDETVPTVAEAERELIRRALRLYGNDRRKTARALGLSDRTLYRRLREYRLSSR